VCVCVCVYTHTTIFALHSNLLSGFCLTFYISTFWTKRNGNIVFHTSRQIRLGNAAYCIVCVCVCSCMYVRMCVLVYIHILNPLNAKLNPICHMLALLEAHHIFHFSGLRVKQFFIDNFSHSLLAFLHKLHYTCTNLVHTEQLNNLERSNWGWE
jgi:hypothetical protein